jgi:hypothetical protein
MQLLHPLHAHRDCPNRKLHYGEYVAYLLLYFFTPVIDSMRGLQQASSLQVVQRKLGLRRFSLGSFSEASHVFDPQLLVPVIEELTGQLGRDLGPQSFAALGRAPTAVDGSLLHALPKMVWALWRDEQHRAAKVRLGCEQPDQLHGRRLRIVQIHVRACTRRPRQAGGRRVDAKTKAYRTDAEDYTLLLVTDLLDLDAELIGELFRHRWQIELFFRWFKRVLEADYMLCQSRRGLTIVTYCALIASVLVTLWTGCKPTKRTYEMLCFYSLGWVDEPELAAHLAGLQPASA